MHGAATATTVRTLPTARFTTSDLAGIAVSQRYADEGRATITGRPGDRAAFKTPTLREVARHPPYMHDGSLQTLRDVILFYERGGVRNPHLDTQIRPLHISADDVDALVDFLRALNGEGFMDRAPTAFPK